MNLENLANMFSQKSGAQQSIGNTVMSTIMNYMMQNFMQKGIGSFLQSGGSDRGSMKSALSQLQENTGDSNHPLVQQIRQNCGLKDNNQARQYTQQGIDTMKEETDSDPNGLQSLIGNFANNKGFDLSSLLGEGQQQKKNRMGNILGF